MKKIKKVCHISTVHPLYDTRIFYKECTSLANAGYNVSLVIQHIRSEIINGIQVVPLPKPKNRLERLTKTSIHALALSCTTYADIYHFHDPEIFFIGLIFKLLGKKVIYDAHEDTPKQILSKQYIPKFFRPMVSKLAQFLENFSAKKFDAIVCSTPTIRDRFLKLGCNAIDVANYPLLSEFKSINPDWSKKDRAVCYVGNIVKIRGIFEIVEAISLTKGVKLFLAGNFVEKKEFETIKKRKGWENVEYLGFIDRYHLASVFSKSIAGLVILHPTLNYIDALPVKMFEYMAAGLPVIASNFSLWREIVEGNKCGICVNPLNPKEIAEAIMYLINNTDVAKEMGENGRNVVFEKYNWEIESNKLIELYNSLFN
ncbi:MAG: glycosyltransferase family 4 protein [Candidatus Bilamarchaeaceae archaeon]